MAEDAAARQAAAATILMKDMKLFFIQRLRTDARITGLVRI
jgi:hypothetical protein